MYQSRTRLSDNEFRDCKPVIEVTIINTPPTVHLIYIYIFFFGGGGDGHLFKAGRLLTFPTFRVGAYSRWALYRINMVVL